MKLFCCLLVLLVFQEANSAVVRKPPAFSTPVYSDSYLPAAIQVIFHAVEQLKTIEEEEASQNTTRASPSATPLTTTQSEEVNMHETSSTTTSQTVIKPDKEDQGKKGEMVDEETKQQMENTMKVDQTSSAEVESSQSTVTLPSSTEVFMEESSNEYQEPPELNEETPEVNYATPETNYESPETVYGVQEVNEEVPEENQEQSSSLEDSLTTETDLKDFNLPEDSSTATHTTEETDDQKKRQPTIDSIVEEIYEIIKPTNSDLLDEQTSISEESKSTLAMSIEKMESIEEEEEETRFTLLGEKVAQVPRPSLSSYLRRAKVPPSATLQQLGSLYDALSKDARKQGFGKYTGYSDEVLRILESSSEGGIAPQLQKILQKVLERSELTRGDARIKTTDALKDLDNPGSNLSKDLRPLLPLRFSR